MSPKKKSDPATELAGLIVRIQADLAEARKICASLPDASAVRPVINEANRALSQVGFSAEVGKLTDG